MSRHRRGGTVDVIAFPQEVQEMIKRLVAHDVPFRQSDGRHIFFYSGDRRERPLKVSAMSNPLVVVSRMDEWARRHVPGWEDR